MKKIIYFAAFALASLPYTQSYGLFGATDSNKIDNSIHVGAPGVKKMKISIPVFAGDTSSGADPKAMTKRFDDILDFTNWFEFLSSNDGAEYAVSGKIVNAGNNKFNLELQLMDLRLKKSLVQNTYPNLNKKTYDIALRQFGDAVVQALTGTPGPFMSRIAFVGRDEGKSRTSRIYIADFDGGHAVGITKNSSINTNPAWSPDGNKLTYTSFVTGYSEIYQYNLITKKTTRMTSNVGSTSGATWSADGSQIAYSTSNQGKTHIYIMNSFSGGKKPLIAQSGIEVEPSFSPNGQYLAFTSNKFSNPMIFVEDLKTGATKRLTYAGWYNASASWSPDSNTIAFASYDRQIDRWDLFKINANGDGLERLTLKQGDNEKPVWSPEGRFIMFQSTRGPKSADEIQRPYQLFVMSKDGEFQKMLHIPIYDVRQPAWGPRMTGEKMTDTEIRVSAGPVRQATHH